MTDALTALHEPCTQQDIHAGGEREIMQAVRSRDQKEASRYGDPRSACVTFVIAVRLRWK
eukprot:COSAG03_NODE_108_length_12558_cov_5.305081_3_plen_60_part_00